MPAHAGSVASPSSALRAYIDTSVVSARARNQLEAKQAEAMERILAARSPGVLEIYVSDLVRAEIEGIPLVYREPHAAEFGRLEELPVLSWHQATPPFPPFDFPHGTRTHPLLQGLLKVLNRADAEHVFQVAQGELRNFITLDYRTILKRAKEIESICGVRAITPVDFELLI
jgi:hypothetical protein